MNTQAQILAEEQTDLTECPRCGMFHRPHRYDRKLCSECYMECSLSAATTCKLCEEREAECGASKITGELQFCLQCYKSLHKI